MPRRPGGHRRRRAGRHAARGGRARRAGPARHGHRRLGPLRPGCPLPARRSPRRPMPGSSGRCSTACSIMWRRAAMRCALTIASSGSMPARRATAHRPSEARPALPHECRHHRRGAPAHRAPPARSRAGHDRRALRPGPEARRHLPVRRSRLGAGGGSRDRGDRDPGPGRHRPGPDLGRRQVSAHHQCRRKAARRPGRPRQTRDAAPGRARMARHAGSALAAAGAGRAAGRDLPPGAQALHGLLSLRGTSGAPDAGHAADAAHAARRPRPAGVHVQRLRPGDLEPRTGPRPRAVAGRGHAGRRPGGVDGRIQPDEAHLPQRGDRFRPDRAPPPRPTQVRGAGDLLLGPAL